jgi:hypothetical protein
MPSFDRYIGPVGQEPMHLKIPHWEREPVVYADQRRSVSGELPNQPLRDAAPRPVFAWARRGLHLDRCRGSIRQVHSKAAQA